MHQVFTVRDSGGTEDRSVNSIRTIEPSRNTATMSNIFNKLI